MFRKKKAGPGCTKLTMSLVNVTFEFCLFGKFDLPTFATGLSCCLGTSYSSNETFCGSVKCFKYLKFANIFC